MQGQSEATLQTGMLQPKDLILPEAKKLRTLSKYFNSLNDTQYYSIFSQVAMIAWLCHLATFFVPINYLKVAK